LATNKAELEKVKERLQENKEQLALLRAEMDQLARLKENLSAQIQDLMGEAEQERAMIESEGAASATLLSSIAQSREEGLKELDKLKGLDCGLKIPSFALLEDLELTALKEEQLAQLGKLQEERENLNRRVIEGRTRREEAEKELANTAELIKLGRCPTCKQSVTAATFYETIGHLKRHIQELEAESKRGEELLAKLDSQIMALKLTGDILDSLASRQTSIKSLGEYLSAKQANIERASRRLNSIEERMKRLGREREESELKALNFKEKKKKLEEEIAQFSASLKELEARLARL